MKKLFFLIIPFFLFISCKNPSTTKNNSSKTDAAYFKVEVIQDGKTIIEKNNVVTLAKKSFKLRFQLLKTDHVFVSASWDKFYYDYPDTKDIFKCNDELLENCGFVSKKTIAEDKFNEDKDICVGDSLYQSVWFYDESMDWHRFDKEVKVKNRIIYAEVTVENIYDLDAKNEHRLEENQSNYKIENINKNIYMVFATRKRMNSDNDQKELQREKFTLKFE